MHSGVEDIFLNESQDNFEGHESSTKIPIGQILQRELQAGAGKKASFVSKGPCFQLQSTGSYSFPPKSTGKAKSLCLAGCKERPKDLLESVLWEIRPCKINHENQAGAENQCGPLLLCPCPVPSSIPRCVVATNAPEGPCFLLFLCVLPLYFLRFPSTKIVQAIHSAFPQPPAPFPTNIH